ncbi:TRAP transporter large permease subunit [Pelagicoccus enzymogenes]|uniref:TRAP transporter large permease n=1 Tax=Pelagicoccus enzymogenes TaxID=2773457 RepID=UPI002810059D|nr:TRAP transporter large permease subunit [Pelagicoccus enzymogenes]MDQ8200925.1 TRAP transporter large permease subunit [Pelagicoccus enzymogenes]
MSEEIGSNDPEVNSRKWWDPVLAVFNRLENWSIAIALGAMMLLPLLEIVMRQFDSGISGNSAIQQHLVLFVAMVGGVIAAREARLLSLSTFTAYLKSGYAAAAKNISSTVAVFVSASLFAGSWAYIFGEFADREGELFPGFPLWWAKLILPFGFFMLTLRLIWQSGDRWWLRLIPIVVSAGLFYFGFYEFEEVSGFVWPLLIVVLIATVLGAPIFVTLAGAALVLFWGWGGYWPEEVGPILALNLYDLVKSPMLVTLPLFTLAGYLLAQGESSQRLIRLINAIFGRVRGGPAIVTVLVCTFFTVFTGASGVTILALGGLLMPVLTAAGYDDRRSIGLLTGAGSLGVLFPPCLPLILYSVVASTSRVSISLEQIFLGGLLPGTLLLVLTIGYGILREPKKGEISWKVFLLSWLLTLIRLYLVLQVIVSLIFAVSLFSGVIASSWWAILTAVWGIVAFVLLKVFFDDLLKVMFSATGEMLLPVVALFALFSGYATPVEAAAVSAFYAMILYIVDAKVVRKVSMLKELPGVMAECGLLVGGVLLILGVAMGFTNYLVTEMIPDQLVTWATENIESPLVFLLLLNLFLIVVGCLMDIFSAIIVIVPLIVPLGAAFGIDPVHLGIIFLANLQLGYITPPIGMNLFLASYRFEKPMSMVIRAALPMLVVFVVGVLLITYWPALTTWLPGVVLGQ